MNILEYKPSFSYNNSDYFSVKIFNVTIPFDIIDSIDSIDIISYNCENSITNWSFSNNYVRLNISLCFKVLYTTKSSKTLNIIKHNTYSYETIHLPNKIDGFYLNSINIKKNLKPCCTVTNLSFLGFTKSTLSFSIIITNIIKILLSPSIIYKINFPSNSSSSYLYSSDNLCKNFVQLTFSPRSYEHICFSLYDDSFFYFENNAVYSYSLGAQKSNRLFIDNLLGWFSNISPNNFILYRYSKDGCCIFIYNMKNKEETLIYKASENCKCFSFVFISNTLGFILSSPNGQYIILLNIYGDILFNDYCDFNNLFINSSGTIALVCNDSTIQVINISSKCFEFISIPLNNFLLKHIVFLSDDLAIICGSSNCTNYIFSFHIKTLCFTELFKSNFDISSIDVTSNGEILFSSNELGLYNLYTLTPGCAKAIVLKLFANNLSLIIRK
ncbi:MAG: hypothetical protein ACRDA5_08075 [Clostridium sp.]